MNIVMLLEMAADAYGDRIALTCGGQSFGYAALHAAARHAGVEVQRSGVGYLGHLAVSGPAGAIGLFAAAVAGVPYVPLNYRLTREELGALIARIDPALLIADPADVADVAVPAGVTVVPRETFLANALEGGETMDAVAGEGDVAVQLFTSGTTGRPKAAILRHANLFSYIVGSVEFGAAGEEEATLVSVPPYHIAGVSAVMSSIYAGRRIVQLPNFDPAEWVRLCREERVTNAFLVPTMLNRVVDYLDGLNEAANVPDLRAIAYGGGRMPLSVVERAMALFPGVNFTNAYGLTETSSTICLLGPDDHRAAHAASEPHIRRRLSSVGRGLPSIELQIRDDAGNVVKEPEVVGRVLVRGSQVSGEYGGMGSLLDAEGWFDTRDRGYLDSEGFLFLDGRADDVIVRGGENISPGEVEDVLLAHPAVADAAVVGIHDEDWGEAVAAAVVLGETQAEIEELQTWVRDRLRSSRVPQKIRFVDELPYNDMGKLLRRVVKSDFA